MRSMTALSLLVLLFLACAGEVESRAPYSPSSVPAPVVQATASAFCPPYSESAWFRPRGRVLYADSTDWKQVIENALDGDEVLLADGTFTLDQYTVQIRASITVRGASGNRDAVVIVGQGYGPRAEGFMVRAPDVTIADLTMRDIRNHAISIKGEEGADRTHLYNLHLLDIGTQHIKGTRDTERGVIACSAIGYSPGAVRGDYIDAIDLQGAIAWTISDNYVYNIWGDGTGCEVDEDCGRYLSGGGPAIQLWRGSRDNVIERNIIVDSFRGIDVGFGTEHLGGIVRNNFVYRSEAGRPGARGYIHGDTGLAVNGGIGTLVDHNTVILAGNYRGPIEVRNANDIVLRNNLVSKPIWNRDGSVISASGNKTDATAGDLAIPGEPWLDSDSEAVDYPGTVSWPTLPADIEGQSRPIGTRPDAGCDELGPRALIFFDGFESGGLGAWVA